MSKRDTYNYTYRVGRRVRIAGSPTIRHAANESTNEPDQAAD